MSGNRLIACAIAVALCLAGCPPSAPTTGYEYLNDAITEEMQSIGLGPGDVFEVRVYGEKDLSGPHRIADDGTIHLPLVGDMVVGGMNRGEIATKIAEKLRSGFLRSPSVSVFVKQFNSRKIFVLGQVKSPGTFPFAPGMNIVEAITRAGGFLNTANANFVVVTRKLEGGEKRIPVPVEKISQGLASNLALQAGDIVFVADRLL